MPRLGGSRGEGADVQLVLRKSKARSLFSWSMSAMASPGKVFRLQRAMLGYGSLKLAHRLALGLLDPLPYRDEESNITALHGGPVGAEEEV